MFTRRVFLKNGGLALFGMGMAPSFLYRTALATPADGSRNKILIAIFQRGAVDGLNTVVPFGEKEYYAARPSIAIPAPTGNKDSVLDLDGFFGLHPSLEPLVSIYKEGRLAIIEAVGSPDSTRSHFDAQDYMESAAPGNKGIPDGWLNRYLQKNPDSRATSFRGVAMGTVLPRSLKGPAPAIAISNLGQFDLQMGPVRRQARSVYESLYNQEANTLLSGTAKEMFEAIEFLKKANPGQYQPAAGVEYPRNPFGESLKQVSQLIKANVGLEVAFVDIGGWDHHVNEGGVNGQLANLLRQFGQGLSALYRDLGERMEDVVVVSMSEFGRTVRENGNAGTDHGHANVMFALGGPVKGGKIYGKWPGLNRDALYEGRDLALTTDFRDVFAELLVQHLGCRGPQEIFPGFTIDPARFKGLV